MKIIVSILLIILIGALSFFFYPVIKAEINLFLLDNNYFHMQIKSSEKVVRKIIPLDDQFGVVINKIGANGKVIDYSALDNSSSYQHLLPTALIHLSNSAYPGQVGNMVIIAQSPGDWYTYTRSNPEFYLTYKLLPQDIIQVYYQGDKFDYLVTKSATIQENQLKDYTKASDKKLLTILSGWPPGTTLFRLVIQAEMLQP